MTGLRSVTGSARPAEVSGTPDRRPAVITAGDGQAGTGPATNGVGPRREHGDPFPEVPNRAETPRVSDSRVLKRGQPHHAASPYLLSVIIEEY